MTLTARPGRRGANALAALALVGGGLLLAAPPAQAAACESTASGVTVVVTHPNGGTSVRCSPGDPGSGAAALSGAGFAVTQVQTMPGFVCRIDGAPASDPCVRTPPTSAYWSYWYAQPGGSWTYSSAGAFGRNPAPGTVEGWAFGAGSPPSVAPPAVSAPAPPKPAPAPAPAPKPAPAPAPAPKPSTTSPKPSASSSSTRPSASSSSSGSASSSSASSSDSASSSSAADDATNSASPTTEPTTATPTTTTPTSESPTTEPTTETDSELAAGTLPAPGGDAESPSGASPQSALPTIAGLGVVGAMLGTAGWMGWRRRTAA